MQVLDVVRRQAVGVGLVSSLPIPRKAAARAANRRAQSAAAWSSNAAPLHPSSFPVFYQELWLVLATLSEILSSRYLAPTPLSKLIVAPRR